MSGYLHGYSPEEQERLVKQAEFWRDLIILPGLPYKAGESLLEIGCGAGAVLKVIAKAHPKLEFHGLDIEPRQIAFAKDLLQAYSPDLRVGDAFALPWETGKFDHAFMMWFLEHLQDPPGAVKEALRVLKPGGTLTTVETDYHEHHLLPKDPDFEYFYASYCELFAQGSRMSTGPHVEGWMKGAGFARVETKAYDFKWEAESGLQGCAVYFLAFMEMVLPRMKGDRERLKKGAAAYREAYKRPGARYEGRVYKTTGFKAS